MSFELDDHFINQYISREVDWGPVGRITYLRTYARPLDSISERHRRLADRASLVNSEEWWLTVTRVVEGTYEIQRRHCESNKLRWDAVKAQASAQIMYDLIFNFKFTPPGRGLWMMGAPVVDKIGGAAANNCAFVSTKFKDAYSNHEPFTFLMDMSMLGVGVGFDTLGAGSIKVLPVIKGDTDGSANVIVPDTREGWVQAVEDVLSGYFEFGWIPEFDYSLIRPAGTPIKSFGGVAAGPEPLIKLISNLVKLLDNLAGKYLTSSDITDIMNMIGVCVVSGNVRRSAELALGSPDDEEFLNLKNYNDHPEACANWRWASNNSVAAKVGMDYSAVAEKTALNGEPGYVWLDNARDYGRMGREPDYKDKLVVGCNPCQPASAPLLTKSGVRTLGEINIGDTIWSGKQWTRVTNKWVTGVKPVYAYKTRAGIFYGTSNHNVISGGVRVHADAAETIDIAIGPYPVRGTIDNQDVVDGLVMGDGMKHKASNDRIVLLVGVNDDYMELDGYIGEPSGVSPGAFNVRTTITASELDLTYLRTIPERFVTGDASKVCGFLRGLYSANGSVCGDRVTLKASSFDVIEAVQVMLSSVGIRSYYTVNKATRVQFSNGEYTCKQSYDLNITTDRNKFVEMIGFIQQYKMDKVRAIAPCKGKSSYEVVEVEYIGEEEVWDITVEADEHTYWTGGLLVSNCAEQSLEDRELCCLAEVYPSRHETYDELERTLKYCYLYTKTVTLIPTHNVDTNAVISRNRRIGVSMTGVVQAMNKHGMRTFMDWCDNGYTALRARDKQYSRWLGVPESVKITSVKPSGTVSLLAGVTPGVHFPHSEFYYRVIRFASNSPYLAPLRDAGYTCYDIPGEANTVAVYFAVKEQFYSRGKADVSMWEQLELAAQMQEYWADNQVSITVTFKPEEARDIKYALPYIERRLKSVSFLPLTEHGYTHAPYQTITYDEYDTYTSHVRTIDWSGLSNEKQDSFCDSDRCELPGTTK